MSSSSIPGSATYQESVFSVSDTESDSSQPLSVVDSSIHLFNSCYVPAGMRSIRLGRGAKENNTAEKMVVLCKNDSDSVTGRENLQCPWDFSCFMLKATFEISSQSNNT